MTPKDPLFGGDFLGQTPAADSLPGAFVHSRKKIQKTIRNATHEFQAPLRPLKNVSPRTFLNVFHRPKLFKNRTNFHCEDLQGWQR